MYVERRKSEESLTESAKASYTLGLFGGFISKLQEECRPWRLTDRKMVSGRNWNIHCIAYMESHDFPHAQLMIKADAFPPLPFVILRPHHRRRSVLIVPQQPSRAANALCERKHKYSGFWGIFCLSSLLCVFTVPETNLHQCCSHHVAGRAGGSCVCLFVWTVDVLGKWVCTFQMQRALISNGYYRLFMKYSLLLM